jgi:P-type Ca2+ transporter type 2C
MRFYAKSVKEVLNTQATSKQGLTTTEAHNRLQEYGENAITRKKKTSPLVIFFRQFKSMVVYILIIATLISLLVKEFLDAYIIIAILVFNAILGFFQEYKAERAIELLKKLTSLNTKVIRSGKIALIPSSRYACYASP